MIKKLLTLAFALVSLPAMAQESPRLEFHSPSAANLIKSIEYPLNYCAGMPQIDIPIYNLEAGSLSMYIQLSFNMDEYTRFSRSVGVAGAGWSLNTDIQITRVINGIDDFHDYGYLRTARTSPAPVSEQTDRAIDLYLNYTDGCSDKYYYKLLDKSGVFYFHATGPDQFEIVPLPANGVKISLKGKGFEIVDTDGSVYDFPGNLSYVEIGERPVRGTFLTWKCSTITSSSEQDVISFTYTPKTRNGIVSSPTTEIYDKPEVYRPEQLSAPLEQTITDAEIPYLIMPRLISNFSSYRQQGEYAIMALNTGLGADLSRFYLSGENRIGGWHHENTESFSSHVMTAIRYGNTRIEFIYDSNANSPAILSEIVVGYNNSPVKTVIFNQAYSQVEKKDHYRYLESIRMGDENYEFSSGFSRHCSEPTYWGYFSGSFYGRTIPEIPYYQEVDVFPNGEYLDSLNNRRMYDGFLGGSFVTDYWSRIVHESFMDRDILTIKLPTGGYTIFTAEQNKYLDRGTVKKIGGYRIKEITYEDSDRQLLRKQHFRYGRNENGAGIVKINPVIGGEHGTNHTEQQVVYCHEADDPRFPGIIYKARKTTFHPYQITGTGYGTGNLVFYDHVTVYESDMGTSTGKTVYTYSIDDDVRCMASPVNPFLPQPDLWDFWAPKSVEQYRYDSGTFTCTKRKDYNYERFMTGKKLMHENSWPTVLPVLLDGETQVGKLFYQYNGAFNYNVQYSSEGCLRLLEETETIFDDLDPGRGLVTRTSYEYHDTNPFLPVKSVVTTAEGKLYTRLTFYPEDYTGLRRNTNMILRNMISTPVETVNVLDGTVISGNLISYDQFGRAIRIDMLEADGLKESQFIYPAAGSVADPRYLEKFNVRYHPSVNRIVDIAEEGKPVVSYLWSFGGAYPIAEILGTDYASIAAFYNSHEPSGLSTLLNAPRLTHERVSEIFDLLDDMPGEKSITMYNYDPLVGITMTIDPSGRKVFYSYDENGRLESIRDENGAVTESYMYNYSNR